VGELSRLIAKLLGGTSVPPLRLKVWDESERSTWAADEGTTKQWLNINKAYPLYKALRGDGAYIAETAILEICKHEAGQSPESYLAKVNLLLFRWAAEAGLAQPSID